MMARSIPYNIVYLAITAHNTGLLNRQCYNTLKNLRVVAIGDTKIIIMICKQVT